VNKKRERRGRKVMKQGPPGGEKSWTKRGRKNRKNWVYASANWPGKKGSLKKTGVKVE